MKQSPLKVLVDQQASSKFPAVEPEVAEVNHVNVRLVPFHLEAWVSCLLVMVSDVVVAVLAEATLATVLQVLT